MLLEQVTANVPTLAEIDDREDGETRSKVRAAFGAAAVSVGSIDASDDETDAVDALANILHHLGEISSFPDRLLARAIEHYEAERAADAGAVTPPTDATAVARGLRNGDANSFTIQHVADQLDGDGFDRVGFYAETLQPQSARDDFRRRVASGEVPETVLWEMLQKDAARK